MKYAVCSLSQHCQSLVMLLVLFSGEIDLLAGTELLKKKVNQSGESNPRPSAKYQAKALPISQTSSVTACPPLLLILKVIIGKRNVVDKKIIFSFSPVSFYLNCSYRARNNKDVT